MLQKNNRIFLLDISRNCIGIEGANAIPSRLNPSLRELRFGENGIGGERVETLADILKHNSGLVRLDLDRNDIGKAGILALANSLKYNQSLKTLNIDIDNFDVQRVFIEALGQSVPHSTIWI